VRKKPWLWGLVLLAIPLIVGISYHYARVEESVCARAARAFPAFEAATPPRPAPRAGLAKADGGTATLADFRGGGLVVNFWATWCPPCVREMPSLDRLRAALRGDGIEVLAVSEDRGGAETVRAFYRENGIVHLPVLVDPGMAMAREARIPGLPATLLIDADGNEVGRVMGAAEWDAPEALALVRHCVGGETK
jgi:thiol-disulfide isomerase/thioredoxin